MTQSYVSKHFRPEGTKCMTDRLHSYRMCSLFNSGKFIIDFGRRKKCSEGNGWLL